MPIVINFEETEDENAEISYNSFDEIVRLNNYNDIKQINCGDNNLTKLP